MHIELRDQNRRRVGWVDVDLSQRPTRVTATSHKSSDQREVFLNWDSAVDDAGQLRRCLACGCTEMFRERAFPQVTAVVVVLAFAGAIIGAFGLAENTPVLIAMAVVLVVDVAILLFSRKRLVCYRCRSTYRDLPIARYHRPWDRARADRVAAQLSASSPPPAVAAPAQPTSPAVAPDRPRHPSPRVTSHEHC